MDEDQRTTFTTQAKPSDSDLPIELRQNLPQTLKDFISKQYAPAFISRLISRQEKYKDKFTEDEKKKIQYWWEGQVRDIESIRTDIGLMAYSVLTQFNAGEYLFG